MFLVEFLKFPLLWGKQVLWPWVLPAYTRQQTSGGAQTQMPHHTARQQNEGLSQVQQNPTSLLSAWLEVTRTLFEGGS